MSLYSDIDVPTRTGWSPLACCAAAHSLQFDGLQALQFLEAGASITVRLSGVPMPHPEDEDEFIQRLAEESATLLHVAVRRLHPAVVELLMEAGADPNLPDGRGETAMDRTERSPGAWYLVPILKRRAKPERIPIIREWLDRWSAESSAQ